MTKQELEEINGNLQVQILFLEEQLRKSPPRELEEENNSLKDEIEDLRARLEDSEAARANLREMVDAYQRQRANELAELAESRQQLSDRRQNELNRLGEEAARLAGERAELVTERERLSEQVAAARSAELQAQTSADNWKKQSTEMYTRMTRAQEEKRGAVEKLQAQELNYDRLARQMEHVQTRDTRAGWIQLLELMAENAGTLWVIVLGFWVLISAIILANWIWNWMWS